MKIDEKNFKVENVTKRIKLQILKNLRTKVHISPNEKNDLLLII